MKNAASCFLAAVCALLLLVLTGCSVEDGRVDNRSTATTLDPLSILTDMTSSNNSADTITTVANSDTMPTGTTGMPVS
ncbi:MAG: hypothetical protein IJU16_02825 [Clostridia bacterium]|nr:hypothetical protein [Clostridia bacterium]